MLAPGDSLCKWVLICLDYNLKLTGDSRTSASILRQSWECLRSPVECMYHTRTGYFGHPNSQKSPFCPAVPTIVQASRASGCHWVTSISILREIHASLRCQAKLGMSMVACGMYVYIKAQGRIHLQLLQVQPGLSGIAYKALHVEGKGYPGQKCLWSAVECTYIQAQSRIHLQVQPRLPGIANWPCMMKS